MSLDIIWHDMYLPYIFVSVILILPFKISWTRKIKQKIKQIPKIIYLFVSGLLSSVTSEVGAMVQPWTWRCTEAALWTARPAGPPLARPTSPSRQQQQCNRSNFVRLWELGITLASAAASYWCNQHIMC